MISNLITFVMPVKPCERLYVILYYIKVKLKRTELASLLLCCYHIMSLLKCVWLF